MVGGDLTLTVLSIEGKRIRVGIDAPSATSIRRGELTPFESGIENRTPVHQVESGFGSLGKG